MKALTPPELACPPQSDIAFYDGANLRGTASLDGNSVATLATSALAVGQHALSAKFEGNTAWGHLATTSSPLIQTVGRVATITALASGANPSTLGTPVAFTATVSGSEDELDETPPSGAVTFFDCSTALGTAQVDSTGTATHSTSSLGVGVHSVTAVYSGDDTFLGGTSEALSQTVGYQFVQSLPLPHFGTAVNGHPAVPQGHANSGNSFRSLLGVYFYNLKMRDQGVSNGTLRLTIHVSDGQTTRQQ